METQNPLGGQTLLLSGHNCMVTTPGRTQGKFTIRWSTLDFRRWERFRAAGAPRPGSRVRPLPESSVGFECSAEEQSMEFSEGPCIQKAGRSN